MTSNESEALLGRHHVDTNHSSNCLWDRLLHRFWVNPYRSQVQHFLTSKAGHYAILLLVSLDVSCIFTDILISLFACEQSCKSGKATGKGMKDAQKALGIVSLVFSCLFVVELLASIWVFNLRYVQV